ncbi:hypothetical protein Barb6_03798 [Bacteroidales bacterium Barb6]|nr:hypothetical protein Barb6_03798 [Bacteroidales bacterium Barb6]
MNSSLLLCTGCPALTGVRRIPMLVGITNDHRKSFFSSMLFM